MTIYLQHIDIVSNEKEFITSLEYKMPLTKGEITGETILGSKEKPPINADLFKQKILSELLTDLNGGENMSNIIIDKYRSRDVLHGDNTEFEFRANYKNAHFSGTVNIQQDEVNKYSLGEMPNLIGSFLADLISKQESGEETTLDVNDTTK